ncbi:hypothetical protein D3C71_2011700 [compost metagenome]
MGGILFATVTVAPIAGVFKALWLERVGIWRADSATAGTVHGGEPQLAKFGFGDCGQIQVTIVGAD